MNIKQMLYTLWKKITTVSGETIIGSTSGTFIALRKCGKLAELYFKYKAAEGLVNSWDWKTIFTLPEEWKPKYGVEFRASSDRTNSSQTVVYIQTDGRVELCPRVGAIDDSTDIIKVVGHYLLK